MSSGPGCRRWRGADAAPLILSLCLVLLIPSPARSADTEVGWVHVEEGAQTIAALMATPPGPGPHPAVIYSHGMIVRIRGHEAASAQGYDTAGYVRALAKAGYVALAPIRDHLASVSPEAAVTRGTDTLTSAIAYLAGRPEVDSARIGAVGFSEGGLITLWSAVSGAGLRAVVLMSPAAFPQAADRSLATASKARHLRKIDMPVFLTVGARDIAAIRDITRTALIPTMTDLGKAIVSRTDYPGDHRWFWTVRPAHFRDLLEHLDRHLK